MRAPLKTCSRRSAVAVLASGVVISMSALTGGVAPAFAKPGHNDPVIPIVPTRGRRARGAAVSIGAQRAVVRPRLAAGARQKRHARPQVDRDPQVVAPPVDAPKPSTHRSWMRRRWTRPHLRQPRARPPSRPSRTWMHRSRTTWRPGNRRNPVTRPPRPTSSGLLMRRSREPTVHAAPKLSTRPTHRRSRRPPSGSRPLSLRHFRPPSRTSNSPSRRNRSK